jgi:hypothetical protein
MALQLRRGTNAERLSMTPVNGELIFVTDYELVSTSVTSIDTTTDTLTTTAAHGLSVNQQVKYIGATLNGLTADQVYFVKTAPTITTFTLSTTLAGSTLDITGSFTVDLVFAKTPTNAAGAPLGTGVAVLWIGDGVTVGGVFAASFNLDDLLDVEITAVAEGNTLYYDATTGFWRNTAIVTVDDVTNNVTLSGDLAVTGGDITTGAIAIANLYNSSAIGTINIGNSVVTEVNIGNAASGRVFAKTPSFETQSNAIIGGDLAVNGGDITTTFGTGNLFNTTATEINIGNAATNAVRIGADDAASTVLIKPGIILGLRLTQNVFNTVATTVNAFGASTATAIGSTVSGTTTIGFNATVNGDLAVNGGDITTTQTTGNLFNATATTVNIGGAATTVDIGANSGTMTIGNPTVVGTQTTQAVFNTVATTVNAFGASTATAIGSTVSGTTTIGYDLVVNNSINAEFISVDNQATLDSSTLTTTSTATVSLNTTTRNAMTGLINIIQGADVHCLNYTVLRVDATTAMLTTYAEMYNTSALATFTADVSAGSLRLRVTPTSATSTVFSVVRTSLT